eukprot:TRINITY_DN4646_c0_g1_i2.p2 TRINITY_DN4646_c0_g1~~TRINITY_DN4646_c0_g1_i2.p2  ORF type:complete len:108 (-),score=20.08 TRINITY_DN4646_c0_g1_i2:136-459(-)
MIPISLDPSFSLRRAPPSQNTAHPSPLRPSSLPRHLSFTLTGEGDREREREMPRETRGAQRGGMCSILRGWCSAQGEGGIERDGDHGFSKLGSDGEDGGRERDGSER